MNQVDYTVCVSAYENSTVVAVVLKRYWNDKRLMSDFYPLGGNFSSYDHQNNSPLGRCKRNILLLLNGLLSWSGALPCRWSHSQLRTFRMISENVRGSCNVCVPRGSKWIMAATSPVYDSFLHRLLVCIMLPGLTTTNILQWWFKWHGNIRNDFLNILIRRTHLFNSSEYPSVISLDMKCVLNTWVLIDLSLT